MTSRRVAISKLTSFSSFLSFFSFRRTSRVALDFHFSLSSWSNCSLLPPCRIYDLFFLSDEREGSLQKRTGAEAEKVSSARVKEFLVSLSPCRFSQVLFPSHLRVVPGSFGDINGQGHQRFRAWAPQLSLLCRKKLPLPRFLPTIHHDLIPTAQHPR